MRNDEWTHALKADTNLVGTLAHSLEWTLDSVDQSLITVVEGIESAGELSPSARMRDRLREVVRFESVVRLHALGNVVVINAQGDVILDSGSQEPRKANVADRDYFLAFKERGHEGLFVGRPVPSRITGVMSLPLARGFRTSQGEFGGIVLGAVRLSYFTQGEGERTPIYTLVFDLYENGVSGALTLDYGDFAIKGDMTRLDMEPDGVKPEAACTP